MTTGPLVSIVLPTYNGSRFLEQSVQSCLDQNYSNWELIIVDDASTDETPSLIARYLKSDVRIHGERHERNRKLPAALNTGFSQVKGDYLTWTSDDNCYRPEALSDMVAFLEDHPEVDVVYAGFTEIDESGIPLRYLPAGMPEDLVNRNVIGACFLYRRIVQNNVGRYAEDLFLAEDYDFWLRVSQLFKLHPLHRDLYLYRSHNTSLTYSRIGTISPVAIRALERNLPYLYWLNPSQWAKGYLRLAGGYEPQNTNKARKYLLQAIRYSPIVVGKKVNWGLILKVIFGHKGSKLLATIYLGLPRSLKQWLRPVQK